MGLTSKSSEFLFHVQKRYGIAWGRTLTLGRQQMYITPGQAKAMAVRFGVPFEAREEWKTDIGFCESFLHGLGAEAIDSMDVSDYEGATIVHDLNEPVPARLHGRFDCILDGGTIEHIFHFPNAIRSCMDMLATGGHYVAITPADNQMGHGFYQFSPELYFRVFSPENGFEVRTMLLQTPTDWLEVTDPRVVGQRGTLTSSVPLGLAILARKVGASQRFHVPQQSDYVEFWSKSESVKNNTVRENESRARHLMRMYVPLPLKALFRRTQERMQPKVSTPGLEGAAGASYRRISIEG